MLFPKIFHLHCWLEGNKSPGEWSKSMFDVHQWSWVKLIAHQEAMALRLSKQLCTQPAVKTALCTVCTHDSSVCSVEVFKSFIVLIWTWEVDFIVTDNKSENLILILNSLKKLKLYHIKLTSIWALYNPTKSGVWILGTKLSSSRCRLDSASVVLYLQPWTGSQVLKAGELQGLISTFCR